MPRPKIMKHMLNENLALTVGRQGKVVGDNDFWNLAFVSDKIVDLNMFYRGGELLLPLYVYIDESNRTLFDNKQEERKPNFSNQFIESLNSSITFSPASLFRALQIFSRA